MSSENSSLKLLLKNKIDSVNTSIQKLVSSKSIPIWVNPNNSNFYEANPYKAGDIVILLSNEDEIYYLLRHYYENIATNLGVNVSMFLERNNPEIDDKFIDIILHGGYFNEDQYMNPMTQISDSDKGYGLYVSLKNQNYDIPGASDSWFNLDMSESVDSMQLQLSRIISILTSSNYISNLNAPAISTIDDKEEIFNKKDSYLENRMDKHNAEYHFHENQFGEDESEDALDKLEKIQSEIEANTNTTTSIMKNPFVFNDEIIGNMITVIQSTKQMFFYCILDTTNLEKDKNITVEFTPNGVSNIIIPIILNTDSGIIEVENANKDQYVLTDDGETAWFANSYVKISNDSNTSNNITLQTSDGFEDANFNNNFDGFMDTTYIATYTPIGFERRTNNISIHGSPVKEISRTNKSLTFQLRSDYVWQYSGIAIALNGKCDINV